MKKLLLAGLLVLLAAGVFVGIVAASPSAHHGIGWLHDYLIEALAKELNIPVDELNSRLSAGETLYQILVDEGVKVADIPALMLRVRKAAINAAFEDGILTQAQADWMLANLETRGSGWMGKHWQDHFLRDYLVAALAKELNLTESEVKARLAVGETPAQIALANGVKTADLPTVMLNVRKAAIQAALEDGVITQAQADRMLSRLEQKWTRRGQCPAGAWSQEGWGHWFYWFGNGRRRGGP
ncbi:MAG: YckD family protein [Anaerolineales bacterium]|nr:YckD family protein [Anaerolineales bacterium]MCX7609942.1 YckD family protein [Anaerolineales bacterium]MDW8227209.1 hypothetical protein [Anaerolineales bacterium]